MNSIISSLLCIAVGILGLLIPSSIAFSPVINHISHQATTSTTFINKSTTSLNMSIIFEPPVEDNCELDSSNCEESVFQEKRRERLEANNALVDRARMQGIELNEIDFQESVDQYQNNPVGGGLIPGLSLSALCEDD
eukprot:755749_1